MLINGWKKLVNQPINFTSILVVQSQYNFICACHVSEASKIQKEIVANFHTNSEHHILVRSQIGTKVSLMERQNIHQIMVMLTVIYTWLAQLSRGKGIIRTILTQTIMQWNTKGSRANHNTLLIATRPNQWALQPRTILQLVGNWE